MTVVQVLIENRVAQVTAYCIMSGGIQVESTIVTWVICENYMLYHLIMGVPLYYFPVAVGSCSARSNLVHSLF
jgi:hypothetical protein